jgi:hypothetical protein
MAKIETPKETVADIIAEMRMGNAGDFPFAYMIGDPDTPEVIDFTTKKVVEPRKINIRRVTVSNLADRLDAAVKRERATCGNAAAMREALVQVRDRFVSGVYDGKFDCYEALEIVESALAKPPRNCDVGTAEEQVARHHLFCNAMMKKNNHCCGPCPCYKFVNGEAQSCTLLWAQMPCEEGGAK